jgi:LPXTG-motif cell wall-anchored protein
VPVWVRQGYFPTWTNPEGEPVYMATPTFQLTFVRQREATVRIQRGGLERGSALLSVVGLALVVGGVVTGRRRKAERSTPPG